MSRYDLTPDDLFITREGSPIQRWRTERKPLAHMRGPHAHGNDVMRVAKADRPAGWMLNPVSEAGSDTFPGEVPLVPECTGFDGIPDWAIAEAVLSANPFNPVSPRGILEKAQRIVKEFRP